MRGCGGGGVRRKEERADVGPRTTILKLRIYYVIHYQKFVVKGLVLSGLLIRQNFISGEEKQVLNQICNDQWYY